MLHALWHNNILKKNISFAAKVVKVLCLHITRGEQKYGIKEFCLSPYIL